MAPRQPPCRSGPIALAAFTGDAQSSGSTPSIAATCRCRGGRAPATARATLPGRAASPARAASGRRPWTPTFAARARRGRASRNPRAGRARRSFGRRSAHVRRRSARVRRRSAHVQRPKRPPYPPVFRAFPRACDRVRAKIARNRFRSSAIAGGSDQRFGVAGLGPSRSDYDRIRLFANICRSRSGDRKSRAEGPV